MRRLLVACLVALVAGVVVSLAAGGSSGGHPGRWVVWDLGTLGGPESVPADINERLQVVGSSDTARKVDRYQYESDAFLWGDWRMRSMGAGTSAAVAINERGQIAGSHRHAFLWQDGQMRDLGTLGGKSSEAVAINERGQVAGRAYTERKDSGGYALEHAFLWTGGRMVDLTARSDDPSWAVTLNDRGQVLVKSLDQDGLWEKGRFVPLEGKFGAVVDLNERGQVLLTDMIWQQGRAGRLGRMLPQRRCEGSDINDRGVVVGACGDAEIRAHPVIWKGRKPNEIEIAFGDRGWAVAVNETGQVVGHSTRLSSPLGWQTRHAFVWENGRTTDLSTLGGRESDVVAINNHGQIIGWAETKTGDRHAVIWTKRG